MRGFRVEQKQTNAVSVPRLSLYLYLSILPGVILSTHSIHVWAYTGCIRIMAGFGRKQCITLLSTTMA